MTDGINTNEAVEDAQAEAPVEPAPAESEPVSDSVPAVSVQEVPVSESPTAQMEGSEPLAEENTQGEAGQAEVRQQADFGEAKPVTEGSGEAKAEPEAVPESVLPTVELSTAQIPPIEPLASAPIKPSSELVSPTATPTISFNPIRELLAKARIAIQSRKRKRLDRIMAVFEKRASITNDEVEKLLHVSDATATRYLSILEQEGKIKQSGKTGKFVSYIKI